MSGIFDVSHMGEFEVTGPDRNAFVNRITCNDVSALDPGGVQYSGLLTREGTFVDDCTVYRFDDRLMLVVNASNRAKAWEHIVDQKQAGGANIRLRDISDDTGLLAVQGPKAEALLQPLSSMNLSSIGYYKCAMGTGRRDRVLHLAHRLHRRGRLRDLLPLEGYRRAVGGRSPRRARYRSDSAPAIRCGWRWATRSTARKSTTRSRRSKPG